MGGAYGSTAVIVAFRLSLNGREPFAGWETAEVLAFVGLVVTAIGLGWTAINTHRASQAAQRLLENELSATLDIPADPHRDGREGDGLEVGNVSNLVDGGPHLSITGAVRNIGRYPARDVKLTVSHGSRAAAVLNQPHSTLFPHDYPADFDFELPIEPVDASDLKSGIAPLFAANEQTRLVFTYHDGNPKADPFEACFTFHPVEKQEGDEKQETWVSTRVPCASRPGRT